MQERLESFRFAFLPTCLLVVGLGVFVSLVWVLIFYFMNVRTNGLWIGLGVVAVAAPVLTLLAVLFFPVSVGTWGLRGFDAWGRYHNVQWSEMTAVRPLNLLGLKYLRVIPDKGRRAIWVPLFLADMGRFRGLIAQHAGAANPLAAALKQPAGARKT
jgi:hypothetical protein